jgi:SAM-dependent methyltransferase
MNYTKEHREQYIEHYSRKSERRVPIPHHDQIERVASDYKCRTVLDYGSGPARSLEHFSRNTLNVTSYDLVIPKMADTSLFKEPFDMVVSHHMLEHVEPECLDSVLQDIRQLTKKVAYIVVSLQESTKTLPNGKPWHLIVHDETWWHKLSEYFDHVIDLPPRDHREYAALVK